ncbi:MAG: peptide deformylase [Thermodesulfobacteriota bacterium]|nr:MAG: peptide deformylase [Thermodesulfobacteriota bacterium]
MPERNILTYPDPTLRKKCDPVEEIDDDLIQLLDDMADTMYQAPGIGLAAPQVGVTKRVLVADIKPRERVEGTEEDEEILLPPDRSELIELINPEIVFSDGEIVGEEGCLSIPGFVSDVKRKYEVTVEGYNRDGALVEIKCEDLLARVFQHEIDHLDGILFIDRLGRLKRELLKKKIEKALGKEEKQAVL